MYSVKIRALLLNKNAVRPACGYGLLTFFTASSSALSFLLTGLCIAYTPDTVFDGYPLYAVVSPCLPPLFFYLAFPTAGVLFAVFAAAFSFAFRAVFYHAVDPAQRRPQSFLFFFAGVKSLYCTLLLTAKRTGLFFLTLLPSALTAAAIRLLLRFYGLPPAVLTAGMAVFFVQFLFSLAVTWILNGRTVPTRYLLYLNPLLKVRAAAKNAAQIMNGNLLFTARLRLSLFPWLIAAILVLPLPFAVCHRGLSMAILNAQLYGEKTKASSAPGVVFYINRRSKLISVNE